MARDTRWFGITEYCNRCGYRVESGLHEAHCGRVRNRPKSWVLFLEEATYSEGDHISLHGMGVSWNGDGLIADAR
jgi:hypothetical protein